MSQEDSDNDEMGDACDNCPIHPNGPGGGTCTSGNLLDACMTNGDCGTGGICSLAQEDTAPPGGNGIGDACDCECNFDGDEDVDGTDAYAFKEDFGRSELGEPCEEGNPCNGDVDCDGDCDGTDAFAFKEDFGRSAIGGETSACPAGLVAGIEEGWCPYE